MSTTRNASHAGSWYQSDGKTLSTQLDTYLSSPYGQKGNKELPVPGARVIIAPHAGYDYSGPTAAYAYASWDLSKAKRIFLLGPSHHHYLTGCKISKHGAYATPLGNLLVDTKTTEELKGTGHFGTMNQTVDEEEHSLEMHAPYIYKMLSMTACPLGVKTPIVPILVGNTSFEAEKLYGGLLWPYLKDPENAFVISSDFCHWGSRFSYTQYVPDKGTDKYHGYDLTSRDPPPSKPTITESIKIIDQRSIAAVETGKHKAFADELKITGNTVCGRHPIGVIMAALENYQDGRGRFKLVSHNTSGSVRNYNDSSVTYVSMYAVV